MRVCLVGPAYPYRGGIAHFTALLAKEFQKSGEVLVINFKRQYPSLLFPGKTQFDKSDSPLTVESERILDTLNPISAWRAARRIAKFRPDFVVFQWWHPFFALVYRVAVHFLKRAVSTKVVFLCHNVLPHENSIIDRTLIRFAFSPVDAFLVQSEQDRRNLIAIRGDVRAGVNPHPIYDVFNHGRHTRASARKQLGLDGRLLLFFGYIRAYKGLNVLLDAFAKTADRLDAKLLIVGEFYEDREPYLSRIKELGIEDRVIVVDRYVPNEEVEMYFAACDVVVLPYRSATQSGIAQISYGFDKPVIVTAVGGLPDVVEDGKTGFVVPPDDPAALADAIRRFFEESAKDDIQTNIAEAKERFSWQRCAERIAELAKDAT